MSSIRQNRIEGVIQEELATYFQRNASEICLGAMVSVTIVRVTSDLSLARIYLSVFAGPDKKEVLENIQQNSRKIRGEVGKRLKNMHKIPELFIFHSEKIPTVYQETTQSCKLDYTDFGCWNCSYYSCIGDYFVCL